MRHKKKYKLGYVPGVYDLFHIGHLNLIRRAKEQSEYLLAGVLSDELVEHFKGKKPYIPFEERIAIVEAVREVDEVVKVDFSNTVKMDAWKLYHYDAYFSGNDHENDWDDERRALRELGSDIVFLPYTKSTSSTKIKEQIRQAGKRKRLYLFGAGRIGQRTLAELTSDEEQNGKCECNVMDGLQNFSGRGQHGGGHYRWEIAGFLDNQAEKHLKRIQEVPVYRPEDLKTLEADNDFAVMITMKNKDEAETQLKALGFEENVLKK